MTIDVATSAIRNTLTTGGGTLEVRYAIEIEHRLTGESRIRLQVRPITQ